MQKMSKYGDIQNTHLTPDKELNILTYRTPSYIIIYRIIRFKNGHFLSTLYKFLP